MGKDRDKPTVDRVLSDIREKFQIEPFQFDPIRHPILARAVAGGNNNSQSSTSSLGDDAKTTTDISTTTNSGGISSSFVKYLNILDQKSSTAQEKLQDVSSLSFSFTDQIEKMISEYLTATMVGVAIGSAVTAGLGAGLVAASNVLSSPKYMKTICQIILRRFRKKSIDDSPKSTPLEGADLTDSNQYEKVPQTDITSLGRSGESKSQIFILHGTVKSKLPPDSDFCAAHDQCQECLDRVSILLVKQGLGWKDARRITAYLVVDCCSAKTFRNTLQQYPLERTMTVVNILFVQKLEYGDVQLEVLACSSE